MCAMPVPVISVHVVPASMVRHTLFAAQPMSETYTRLELWRSITMREIQRAGSPTPFASTRVHVGLALVPFAVFQTWPLLYPTHTISELASAIARVEMFHGEFSAK